MDGKIIIPAVLMLIFTSGCVQQEFAYNGFTAEKKGDGSIYMYGAKNIFFNPEDAGVKQKADYILYSYDDCDTTGLEELIHNDTIVVGTFGCVEGATGIVYSMEQTDTLSFNFGEVVINSVPVNKSENGIEKKGNGYLVTVNGMNFYYVGETDSVPLINNKIDIAFLPAAGSAMLLKPNVAVPVYTDAAQFKKTLEGTEIEVKLA